MELLVARGQLFAAGQAGGALGRGRGDGPDPLRGRPGGAVRFPRAQLERTRLGQRRVALEGEERTRLQALNRLRVHPLEEPVPTPRPLAAFADPSLRSAEEAVDDAERRSPDLAVAALAVQAAERRVDSARQDWFPDLAVTAGVMPRGQIEPMWTVQLGITLPVWGATKQARGVEESQARREADLRGEEAIRQLVRLRARERRTLIAAALRTLEIDPGRHPRAVGRRGSAPRWPSTRWGR